MKQKPVSILIVTWNAWSYTKKCIDSIKRYTNYPYTITVIDNASTDETLRYLKHLKQIDEINVVTNRENVGYGQAIVQGYEESKTELVCVMNNDVVVSPGWLEPMVKVMRTNPEIGILGPLTPLSYCLHPYNNQDTRSVLKETKGEGTPTPEEWLNRFCHPFSYEDFVNKTKERNNFGIKFLEGPPSMISTFCALTNRELVNKVGGFFDPVFYKYGCEDVDLCWRLSSHGYKFAITSEAYVHHFKHISSDEGSLNRNELSEQNMKKFFNKWEGTIIKFLSKKILEGKDMEKLLTEANWEYWFLARLENVVGYEEFWRRIEGSHISKEKE